MQSTVLIVDRDEEFKDRLGEILAGTGYHVLASCNLAEGVALLQQYPQTAVAIVRDNSSFVKALGEIHSPVKVLNAADLPPAFALDPTRAPAGEWLHMLRMLLETETRDAAPLRKRPYPASF